MPSVRDSLKDERPARNNAQQGLDLDDPAAQTVGQPGPGESQAGLDQADLIAARLKETADQRAAMAQTEINKLQNHIEQLQQRMEELTKLKMPPGNISADLEDAMMRLEDANADLARAHEAKENTELTSSLRQEHHEPSLHVDHSTHQGHGVGGTPKVGQVLGHSGGGGAPPKVGVKGFKR